MELRGWVKRLEREARGEMIAIRQPDGTVERFPESELAAAYLNAFDRAVSRSGPEESWHPLCVAARNSSDPTWRESFYAAAGAGTTDHIEDLSE